MKGYEWGKREQAPRTNIDLEIPEIWRKESFPLAWGLVSISVPEVCVVRNDLPVLLGLRIYAFIIIYNKLLNRYFINV